MYTTAVAGVRAYQCLHGAHYNQHRLFDLLVRATEVLFIVLRFHPGNLFTSLDGTSNDVRPLLSHDTTHVMRKEPGPLPFFEEALTFASFEPGMYEIVKASSRSIISLVGGLD